MDIDGNYTLTKNKENPIKYVPLVNPYSMGNFTQNKRRDGEKMIWFKRKKDR